MSSTAVEAPARAVAAARHPRRWGRWVAFCVVLTIALGMWARHRIEEDQLRRPLEVVQNASIESHKPIGVLSPSAAKAWTDGSGPSEQRVRALVQSGNVYLEPLFFYFSGRHGGHSAWSPPAQSRCYYFAAQRGSEFDARRVSALVRLCYVDGNQGAYAAGWVAIH